MWTPLRAKSVESAELNVTSKRRANGANGAEAPKSYDRTSPSVTSLALQVPCKLRGAGGGCGVLLAKFLYSFFSPHPWLGDARQTEL